MDGHDGLLSLDAPAALRVQRVRKGRFLGLTGLTAGGFLSLTAPLALRVVVAADAVDYKKGARLRHWTHLRREGSEGSEGSKGSKGGGIALSGDEFYNAACGGHVHIEYHNHSYPRTPLRHFVALFP